MIYTTIVIGTVWLLVGPYTLIDIISHVESLDKRSQTKTNEHLTSVNKAPIVESYDMQAI